VSPDNERKLARRVAAAGEAALAARGYVTAIDILVGVDWLATPQVERWRRGQLPYLERGATASLKKLGTALRLLRRWAEGRGLRPSQTAYRAATRDRRPLRFSKTGEPEVERAYHTHWVSPALPRRQQGAGARSANSLADSEDRPGSVACSDGPVSGASAALR
jgi:hypothetical protein